MPAVAEPLTFLESLRQQAILGSILGIRRAIATFNPTGPQSVMNDETAAQSLLAQGNYERAFEVATGFADYFEIYHQGNGIGASGWETGAVMMGHATGFNQAVETVKGETRSGAELSGFDRFATGLDALIRIASTVMTVAGGVQSMGLGNTMKVVSPVYRIAGRDIVVVETSVGRQAFYRSTGANSGSPGKWFPVDELRPADGWFNKAAYTQGPGLAKGRPLHRLGSSEFADISKKLGEMSIPKGQLVPAGKTEIEEMTMNRILDFFGARRTPTTYVRPVPEK
ncbi:MAG: hypothetical protein PHR30_09060 [Gallionellaceae bacterium]|nr:hypothetical protein [Gallionellaceae bacterium]